MAPSKKSASPICLQERDVTMLRGLFESRVMTIEHIAMLFFDGREEAAKKRLQKLKGAGLIGERPRRAFERAVLFLTRQGLAPLHQRGILHEYPKFDLPSLERRARVSALTLNHELEVMDVKSSLHRALAQSSKYSLAEFNTWPLLNEFTASRSSVDGAEITVRPDGFVRIHERETDGGLSEHSFFLEVDRSTETQDTLCLRASCYLDYYRSGGFAEKSGGRRSNFKDYPFRVLIVCKTEERRNNTAAQLIQGNPPIFTQVWLTTLKEVTTTPLSAIWIRPLDLRDALADTPFAESSLRPRTLYQRQAAREALIRAKVKKHLLLSEAESPTST